MDYIAPDNIYWLFSSSAQSVSTFIALLVAGFALVQTKMDSLQDNDETLEEIHDKLKTQYYKRIKGLSFVTGFAIFMSLLMVYLNGFYFPLKEVLYFITVILNTVAIGGGILFVVSIIDPGRYKKAAEQIIKDEEDQFSQTGNSVDQLTFMTGFITLEKKIREILQSKNLYIPYGNEPKMAYSFRQMIQSLLQNDLINKNEYYDLLQINKYRNLVFHGHLDNVDKGMVDRVNKATTIIKRINNPQ